MSSGPWRSVGGKDSASNGPDGSDRDFRHGSEKITKRVTLTRRDVQAATRLLDVLAGWNDDGQEPAKNTAETVVTGRFPDRKLLVEHARRSLAGRSLRSRFFNKDMFGEAAWDMLLALYVAKQSGTRHTVSALVNLSGVAPTTALRWLDFLQTEQLVSRRSSPTDKRVFYVEPTDKALTALDAYFSATMAPTI